MNIFISINFPATKEEYRHIPITIIDIGKREKAEYILNGEKICIESRTSTYKNSRGKILTEAQIIDITERKKREDETRKLSAIIEQSPLSIFITDLNGNIEFVNEQFPKQTGYSYREVKGKTPRIFKSGEHPESFYKELWNTITSGKTWYGELHNKRKDGKLFWEKTIISPIFNNRGGITNFAGIKEDITNQKILKQKLERSQKLEILGQFAGGIAHDFNNILTVINGYSTLILDSLDKNSMIRDDIEQIKSAGERATALTRQLLVFSKTRIKNQRVVNINREIKNAVKMLKRLIGEDIQLKFKLADRLLNIKADPAQIDQLIMNLAVNSRDAMPYGGMLIISTSNRTVDESFLIRHPDTAPGEYAEVIVKDTGTRMDKGTAERIFEPFFTTKGKEHGTGLGLSTVYGIVKQNKGYIEVESEKENGTSFTILFPVVHETEEKKIKISIKTKIKKDWTILIVEDEEPVRNIAEQLLLKAGCKVLTAKNGKEALEIHKTYSGNIDLLLTDVIMPLMNCNILSNTIIKDRPEIKTVFMSGYTSDIINRQNISGSEILLLRKPFEPEELLTIINKALKST